MNGYHSADGDTPPRSACARLSSLLLLPPRALFLFPCFKAFPTLAFHRAQAFFFLPPSLPISYRDAPERDEEREREREESVLAECKKEITEHRLNAAREMTHKCLYIRSRSSSTVYRKKKRSRANENALLRVSRNRSSLNFPSVRTKLALRARFLSSRRRYLLYMK